MTPEQRAAIEARLATATLPWTKAGPNIRIKGKGASVWIDMDPGDEAFIRNAPTDIAALLADNAALRAALEGLLRATEFPVMTIEGQVKATHGTVELARLEPLLPAAAAARAALAEQPDREGT